MNNRLQDIDLSFSIDLLWLCKDELEKSRSPLFINDLIFIMKKILRLHNKVKELNGEKIANHQKKVEPILGNWNVNQPDFEYINILLGDVIEELGKQKAGKKFNKKVGEILDQVKNLYKDYENAIFILKHLDQIILKFDSKNYNDLKGNINPKFIPLLMSIREPALVKVTELKDPLKKDLPPATMGAYGRSIQKITTYETGSKAALMEQGRGLSANLFYKYK